MYIHGMGLFCVLPEISTVKLHGTRWIIRFYYLFYRFSFSVLKNRKKEKSYDELLKINT